MRNLILFILRYQFTFLFVLLEVIAVALLASGNSYHNSLWNRKSTAVAGIYYGWRHQATRYIGLMEDNESLRRQNAHLVNQLWSKGDSLKQVEMSGFRCIPSTAITSTFHLGNNYVVIKGGSRVGIRPESGVISPDGLIGVVHSVSDHYSTVTPIIHNTIQVSARLKKNAYFGLCSWTGHDDRYVMLNDIPNHVVVEQGDSIVTRGSSGIFPQDILIGFAEGSVRDESSGFQRIAVRLSTDFRRLHSVYVIVNEYKNELDSLENLTNEWIKK